MSVQYTGGCSVHCGILLNTPGVFSTVWDTMSTAGVFSGEYHEYSGGFSTLEVTMSTLGISHDEYEEYHQYTSVNPLVSSVT